MDILDDIQRILRKYCDEFYGGNIAVAAEELNVKHTTLWRWINGKSSPKIDTLIPVFKKLNARILLPSEAIELQTKTNSTEICDIEKIKLESKMEGMLDAIKAMSKNDISFPKN